MRNNISCCERFTVESPIIISSAPVEPPPPPPPLLKLVSTPLEVLIYNVPSFKYTVPNPVAEV